MNDVQQTNELNKSSGQADQKRKKEGIAELMSLAWKGLLFCGGIFLLIFFMQVGFLPDFKLTDLTAMLAAVSLIGLLILFIFAGSFVMPVLLAGSSFVHLKSAKFVLRMSAIAGALPVWAISLSALLGGKLSTWIGCATTLSLELIVAAYFIHRPTSDKSGNAKATRRDRNIQASNTADSGGARRLSNEPFLHMLLIGLAFFFGQFIATYYFVLTYRSSNSTDQVVMLFTWPVVCFFVNIALLENLDVDNEKQRWMKLGVSAGVLLLLFLLFTSASSMMTGGIARRLALGNIPGTVVTLSKKGCEIAEASSQGSMQCRYAKADAPGVICPVTIISRVGSEFVLQPEKSNFEVVIKSAEILGWARLTPAAFATVPPITGDNEKSLELRCSVAGHE